MYVLVQLCVIYMLNIVLGNFITRICLLRASTEL